MLLTRWMALHSSREIASMRFLTFTPAEFTAILSRPPNSRSTVAPSALHRLLDREIGRAALAPRAGARRDVLRDRARFLFRPCRNADGRAVLRERLRHRAAKPRGASNDQRGGAAEIKRSIDGQSCLALECTLTSMPNSAGRVESINTSRGGVPKTAVLEAQVTSEGIVGDVQRDLRYHGGPERAVSIYSLELIAGPCSAKDIRSRRARPART